MRIGRVVLAGAAAVAMSISVPPVTSADPGDPGEPQAVVWVDGYGFFGAPYDQMVSGQGWQEGEEIDVYINGVYKATRTAEPNAEGSATPQDYVPDEPIVPGDVIRLEGDSGIRQHTVTTLSVTNVNAGLDQVTGTAEPGAQVLVVTGSSVQVVTADSERAWTADFSSASADGTAIGSIGPGTIGVAAQIDTDADPGDITVVGWSSPGKAPLPAGFAQLPEGWDDGAATDFGFGEVSYVSCPEVPEGEDRVCPEVEWKFDEKIYANGSMVEAIIKLSDVRYVKQDPEAEGPEYFDVLSGIFVNQVKLDSDGGLVRFTASWSWQIQTDTGETYQTTGEIRDFDDGAAPWDYHRWKGPIIEP